MSAKCPWLPARGSLIEDRLAPERSFYGLDCLLFIRSAGYSGTGAVHGD